MTSMEVDSPAEDAAGAQSDSNKPVDENSMDAQPSGSTDQPDVMAAPSTQGSVTLSVHPLVIMNISEHYTRTKAQMNKSEQVFGAIIGRHNGRHLELVNSFEISVQNVDGFWIVDTEFFRTREAQYKEVFASLEFLGWYTTGDMPTESDIAMHRQMSEISESPVFLKLDPAAKNTQEKLPVRVFESVIDIVEGEAKMLFIPLNYNLVTEEAERIGVDHVARISRASSGHLSVVTEQMIAEYQALKMLHSRILLILRYMSDVQNGKLPLNHGVMREVNSLCRRLPVISTDKFKKQFYYQCNDVALIAYLGALTKTCDTLNQLVNKLNVIQDSRGGHHHSRRMMKAHGMLT